MNRFLNRVTTLFLMLLSVIPLVHLILCSFELEADQRLPLFLLAAVLFCWLVFSFLPYKLPGLLPCAALTALFCFGRRELLAAQFNDILDRVAVTYYLRFGSNENFTLISQVQSHTEALLILGLVMAALLGLALNSREERVFLSMLVCIPVTLLCLLVCGNIPAWIMLCLSLFAVLLLCTGRLFERDSNLGRSFFVLILPVTLMLCGLLTFKGPASYNYDRQDRSLLQLAQAFTNRLTAAFNQVDGEVLPVNVLTPNDNGSIPNEENDRWSDGAGRLDVAAVTDEDQLQDVLMRVTAGRDGHVYLRHCSYGGYTGTGWGTAPEYPGGSVPNFAARAVENSGVAETEEVRIELVAAGSSLLYLPYYTEVDFDSDAYANGSGIEYSLTHMSYEGSYRVLSLPANLRDAELAYRQFVYGSYLSLPESTRDALLDIAEENALNGDDVLESVSLVAEFVRNSAVYNIDTQPYPSEDYAVYLLTEGTEGYCVHFATAAAAMYRALGIPARLVSGVLAETVADTPVEVRRLNEHAWVEVYLDGIGWLPVEVTPGTLDGSVGGGREEPAETAQPDAGESQSTPVPVPSPAPDSGNESGAERNPIRADTKQPDTGGISTQVLLALLAVLALLAAPFLWYLGRRQRWKKQLGGERNKAAISIWRCAKRICSFGGNMPPVIAQNAQRAFYGRGLESANELKAGRQALEQLREETYSTLPWHKKMIFKYVHGLK
ncbi:MAG: transglutaminase domain-containing protein [Oscillospiraceae bacterium]|nr:transglutaminase domain-containing protein [Oscillospiraceae bacterium]